METALREIVDRQAIHDCLVRYARGMDRLDRELILSAFHPDAIDEHGKFVGHPAEFAGGALEQLRGLYLSHQHYLMNHACELAGDVAHAETYFLFVAMNRSGKPMQMNGGRFVDRFERREGRWAIAYREVLRDWADLDHVPQALDVASISSIRNSDIPPAMRRFMSEGPVARRDRGDRSYARPLVADPQRIAAYRRLQHG